MPWFALAALTLQGFALSAFLAVARTDFASYGKPTVLVAAAVSMGLLLWFGLGGMTRRSLFVLPAACALAWVVRFTSSG